jgi:hypothetical protein
VFSKSWDPEIVVGQRELFIINGWTLLNTELAFIGLLKIDSHVNPCQNIKC